MSRRWKLQRILDFAHQNSIYHEMGFSKYYNIIDPPFLMNLMEEEERKIHLKMTVNAARSIIRYLPNEPFVCRYYKRGIGPNPISAVK